MKIALAIGVLFIFLNSFGQIGVGISYATSKALDAEILYKKEIGIFKLGASVQFSNTRGEAVDKQLSNYGQTQDGSGKYFYSIDLGYGRVIKDKFHIDAELSFGELKYFTNYLDNRFTGGGYHLITKSESVFGAGLKGGYFINEHWNVFAGINSVRKVEFGLRIWL